MYSEKKALLTPDGAQHFLDCMQLSEQNLAPENKLIAQEADEAVYRSRTA